MANLRDELLRFPEAWRPELGEVLIGVIVDLDERRGFAGHLYPVVVVRTEQGEDLAFHAFHTVAKDELARLEPKVGETIGIAYHGRAPGKDYERYRIKVVREEGAQIDWEHMRPELEQATAPAAPAVDDEFASAAEADAIPS